MMGAISDAAKALSEAAGGVSPVLGGHTYSDVAAIVARAIERGRVPTDVETASEIEAKKKGIMPLIAPMAKDEGEYSRLAYEMTRHISEVYGKAAKRVRHREAVALGQELLRTRLAPIMEETHSVKMDCKPTEYIREGQQKLKAKGDKEQLRVLDHYIYLAYDFIDTLNAANIDASQATASYYFFLGVATREYFRGLEAQGVKPPPFLPMERNPALGEWAMWYEGTVVKNIRRYLKKRRVLACYADVFAPTVRLEAAPFSLEKITEMLADVNSCLKATLDRRQWPRFYTIAELAPTEKQTAVMLNAMRKIDLTKPATANDFNYGHFLELAEGGAK